MATDPRIVAFRPEHAPAFRALNLAWIRQHWEPEEADYQMLDNPQSYVLEPGGYIAIAELDDQVVGSCALIRMDDTTYELAKMAVDPAAKGQGIGRLLGQAVIDEARRRGAASVYLESNTVLGPALALYRSLGFASADSQPSPYARCNVQMTLNLVDEA